MSSTIKKWKNKIKLVASVTRWHIINKKVLQPINNEKCKKLIVGFAHPMLKLLHNHCISQPQCFVKNDHNGIGMFDVGPTVLEIERNYRIVKF